MKRLLSALLLLLAVSCGNKPETRVYIRSSLWIIGNATEEAFNVSWNFPGDSRSEEHLRPRDLTSIGSVDSTIPYVKPEFGEIQKLAGEEEMTISLYSDDGKLLKEWRWSERDSPGRQIFDESLWEKDETEYYNKITDAVWHFYILPEDIGQGEN